MQIRVVTLKFSPALGGFDDEPLRDLLKDKEVLSISDHFFLKDGSPYLVVVVTYNVLRPEEESPASAQSARQRKREEWREILKEGDWPLFNSLRDWRNTQAKEEGVPPYVICTNRQLAPIAHGRPPSLTKLASTEGFGKAKVERYGGALVKIVSEAPEPTPEPVEESVDGNPDKE